MFITSLRTLQNLQFISNIKSSNVNKTPTPQETERHLKVAVEETRIQENEANVVEERRELERREGTTPFWKQKQDKQKLQLKGKKIVKGFRHCWDSKFRKQPFFLLVERKQDMGMDLKDAKGQNLRERRTLVWVLKIKKH